MPTNELTVEQNTQLTTLAQRVAAIEYRLENYKKLQEEEKQLKAALYETPATEREVEVFDEKLFREEKPDIYYLYTRKEIKRDNGRKGYVRITLRKAKGDG